MFNKYIWKLYLTAGGNHTVKMFRDNLSKEYTVRYPIEIKKLQGMYCPAEKVLNENYNQLMDIFKDEDSILPNGVYTLESAMDFLWDWINEENDCQLSDLQILEVFISNLAFFTTSLCMALPDFFIPYYFQYNFNVLQKISDEFDIALPIIPVKKKYKERFYYYGEICHALQNFRLVYGLSVYELYAFLYDHAPKYIGGIESYIINSLPEPKAAYFIGGSKTDIFLDGNNGIVTPWQCSPETRAGDMIVMYLRAPVSAVNSIWRSVSIGFKDPFFYYYQCTYIGNSVLTERVSIKQLKSDFILGNMPIVKKNMQGINGVELKPSEYNYLCELTNAEALKLECVYENTHSEIVCEKDVEDKLVKPLLKKLGYTEKDYVQQMYLEFGNQNHALIPDIVLLPNQTKDHQSAFAIIEAKRKIANRALRGVKKQARSYAKHLSVNYSIIASMDKLWISTPNDDFEEDIFESTWNELNDVDIFSKLNKLIGKK